MRPEANVRRNHPLESAGPDLRVHNLFVLPHHHLTHFLATVVFGDNAARLHPQSHSS